MRINTPRRIKFPSFTSLFMLCASLLCMSDAQAQETYKRPPKQVLDVLEAAAPPLVSVSPARDRVLLAEAVRYPPVADLAQPVLRIAGLRINPRANAPYRQTYFSRLTIKTVADNSQVDAVLPAGSRASLPAWSPDGKQFAFLNTIANGVELYVGDAATGRTRRIDKAQINSAYGDPFRWLPDSRSILVQLVPRERSAPPSAPNAPAGPNVQESSGKAAPVRTFQDLLKNPHDEQLFDYHAASQLAIVDTSNNNTTLVGAPAIYQSVEPAPDGQHMLVARLHRPYSYLYPHWAFPKTVEVINRKGESVYKLADLPLQDQTPIDGVPTGARSYEWIPTAPATLVWAEALDGGDPKRKVPHRDTIKTLDAPFAAQPSEMTRTAERFAGVSFLESTDRALIRDYNRDTKFARTMIVDLNKTNTEPRVLFNLSVQDRYNDPGQPVTRRLSNGHNAILLHAGKYVYLTGQGASAEGERPFLDRFDIETAKSERLFRADAENFESFVALVHDDASRIITRRENPTEPPNLYVRSRVQLSTTQTPPINPNAGETFKAQGLSASYTTQPLTNFSDPAPQLRGIKKQLVTYKRADGVPLSFTLYLPPDHKPGTRLPTIVWAYPLEFTDAGTAGQVSGSTNRFTLIGGYSHLFFLLNGYAVLDNTAMPVVGSVETANNTFVEQITASAKAAIDKAVEMGVTDPERVGVGGHSYGAFMTANLLAHTDLFRAGIARSGAYNRTLTPFGFQGERRTFWEAPDVYTNLSPFRFANKIDEPVLLIHGEADDNTGTFPIQSERLYQAVRGNGGTVRYVTLPFEAHGYQARESVEHTIYEMLNWFDRHVKNAAPRSKTNASTTQASSSQP